MKRILYSNGMKAVAVLFFIASVVLGALTITCGIARYSYEKEHIYDFERDFSETKFFSHLLVAPESAIFDAYYGYYNSEYAQNGDVIPKVTDKTLLNYIDENLKNLYCMDKVDYFIKWNHLVFTNCGASDAKDLMQAQFYRYIMQDAQGNTEIESSQTRYYLHSPLDELIQFNQADSITVCTSIKEDYSETCRGIWYRQASIINRTCTYTLFCGVLALLLLIYLLCVCGSDKDGAHKRLWVDNIWAEVHLVAMGGAVIGAVILCVVLLDAYSSGHFPHHLLYGVIGTAATLAGTVVITSSLSMVRNIKSQQLIASSFILKAIKWVSGILKKGLSGIGKYATAGKQAIFTVLSEKTGLILISMLFAYTALIGLCGMFTWESPVFLILGIVLFGVATFTIAYRAQDIDAVKKGAKAIRNGQLTYKIPTLKCEDMQMFAEDINDIARGLDESVAAKLKAERLKTELITNVSHDLKTPLTSIISYTELLSGVADLPEEARDYIQIIAQKSDRLKMLTQDLFAISKVQSGNETVILEKLDVSLLINQSLGEHDAEIKRSEVPFCVHTQKELYIQADGRKMSRVVGNLINNILKYTLKQTRVFITTSCDGDDAIMEFKNIASYPMDFQADEIVGRFVRGDAARSAEGSGLGLCIAKSYTELCGGTLSVIVDGDMFKVIIRFKRYLEEGNN